MNVDYITATPVHMDYITAKLVHVDYITAKLQTLQTPCTTLPLSARTSLQRLQLSSSGIAADIPLGEHHTYGVEPRSCEQKGQNKKLSTLK